MVAGHYSGEGNLIEGSDPLGAAVPVAVDFDGKLLFDFSGGSVTVGDVRIEDTAGRDITTTDGSINVYITNFPASQTVNQGLPGDVAWPVSLQGAIPVTSAELRAVPSSTSPVLLLPAHIDTKTFSIFNQSKSYLYIKFGLGVTSTFFNFRMPPNSFYEPNIYTFSGDIWGVWDSIDGQALVSQLF